jgi:photosystem II cytochrome c550
LDVKTSAIATGENIDACCGRAFEKMPLISKQRRARSNKLNALRRTIVKRLFFVAIATVLFLFQFQIGDASALELDASTRTITLNPDGETVVLSSKEVTEGQRLFNSSCTKCHLQGKTKTNNNVSLGVEDLSGAEPPRNNLLALVDYLKHPTSYDGENDLFEEHPNVARPDLYPELRNLTEDDVYSIAGYMLVAPKLDQRWGGTIYF